MILQTTTMMPAVAEQDQSPPDLLSAATAAGSKEDEMNYKRVLHHIVRNRIIIVKCDSADHNNDAGVC